MLETLGMNPSAIATAQLMVSNCLIEPLSEWALIDWSYRTALPELLDIRKSSQPDDEQKRVYQMLGIDWKSAFLTQKTEIQA
jgi:hypothetical protein